MVDSFHPINGLCLYRIRYNYEEEPPKNSHEEDIINKYKKKLSNFKIRDENKKNKFLGNWKTVVGNLQYIDKTPKKEVRSY